LNNRPEDNLPDDSGTANQAPTPRSSTGRLQSTTAVWTGKELKWIVWGGLQRWVPVFFDTRVAVLRTLHRARHPRPHLLDPEPRPLRPHSYSKAPLRQLRGDTWDRFQLRGRKEKRWGHESGASPTGERGHLSLKHRHVYRDDVYLIATKRRERFSTFLGLYLL